MPIHSNIPIAIMTRQPQSLITKRVFVPPRQMSQVDTDRVQRKLWFRRCVASVLCSVATADLYNTTYAKWSGGARIEIFDFYSHGLSPMLLFVFLILAASIVLIGVDTYALLNASTNRHKILRAHGLSSGVLFLGLIILFLPADISFATTVHLLGQSKNARVDLHNAAAMGRIHTVRALLGSGAPHVLRADGVTVLHVAAKDGRIGVLDAAVAKGADINAQTARGDTPLHRAAAAGQMQAVRYLLELGARRDLRDASGRTAEILAVEKGQRGIAQVLKP